MMTIANAYVGIDPGSQGAVAVIRRNGSATVMDMPSLDEVVNNLYRSIVKMPEGYYSVAIESVHPLPGQSCKATFSYGQNFLLAKVIGKCYNINPEMVTPQRWKNFFGLKREKGESKAMFKHKSIAKAKEIFPELSSILLASKDGRAEALLIAVYKCCTDAGISLEQFCANKQGENDEQIL